MICLENNIAIPVLFNAFVTMPIVAVSLSRRVYSPHDSQLIQTHTFHKITPDFQRARKARLRRASLRKQSLLISSARDCAHVATKHRFRNNTNGHDTMRKGDDFRAQGYYCIFNNFITSVPSSILLGRHRYRAHICWRYEMGFGQYYRITLAELPRPIQHVNNLMRALRIMSCRWRIIPLWRCQYLHVAMNYYRHTGGTSSMLSQLLLNIGRSLIAATEWVMPREVIEHRFILISSVKRIFAILMLSPAKRRNNIYHHALNWNGISISRGNILPLIRFLRLDAARYGRYIIIDYYAHGFHIHYFH